MSDDVVFDARWAESDEDVVVPVMVHEHGRVGREVNLEHAHVLVFEQQVMAGLGGDLDFGGGLGGENDSEGNIETNRGSQRRS